MREHHGAHAVPPKGVDRHRQHERRVDAAGEAEQDAGKLVLADVIAHAHHQSVVDMRLEARIERSADPFRRITLERDERHRLVPCRQLLDEHAGRVGDKRGAVEHELVLAAYAIDVDDRQSRLPRARAHVLAPKRLLFRVVRRAVGDDDERARPLFAWRIGSGNQTSSQMMSPAAVDVDDARLAARFE